MRKFAVAALSVVIMGFGAGTAHAEDGPETVNSPTFNDSPVQIVFCLAPGACRL